MGFATKLDCCCCCWWWGYFAKTSTLKIRYCKFLNWWWCGGHCCSSSDVGEYIKVITQEIISGPNPCWVKITNWVQETRGSRPPEHRGLVCGTWPLAQPLPSPFRPGTQLSLVRVLNHADYSSGYWQQPHQTPASLMWGRWRHRARGKRNRSNR